MLTVPTLPIWLQNNMRFGKTVIALTGKNEFQQNVIIVKSNMLPKKLFPKISTTGRNRQAFRPFTASISL